MRGSRSGKATVTACWVYCGLDMAAEAEIWWEVDSNVWSLEGIDSVTLIEVGGAKVREDMDTANLPVNVRDAIREAMCDIDPYDDDGRRADWAYQQAKDRRLEERA